MSEAPTQQYKETIPLWLAVGITVVISVPFSLWLGGWNFAVWVSFVAWASYFALGAKPAAAKTIIPAFAYAALVMSVALALIPLLGFIPSLIVPGDLAVMLVFFVFVCFLVYSMRWTKVFQEGSLPFFNGMSMVLAVYFTGSFPQIAPAAIAPIWAGVWTVILGTFGVLLGIFNVWLTFPKPVATPAVEPDSQTV